MFIYFLYIIIEFFLVASKRQQICQVFIKMPRSLFLYFEYFRLPLVINKNIDVVLFLELETLWCYKKIFK